MDIHKVLKSQNPCEIFCFVVLSYVWYRLFYIQIYFITKYIWNLIGAFKKSSSEMNRREYLHHVCIYIVLLICNDVFILIYFV